MSKFPKDGSTFVVESIDRIAYRWAKYKPDGARQMKKPGRWQKQVWSGDYFTWERCEDPQGELCEPMTDGPISSAFKQHAEIQARISALEADNKMLKANLSYIVTQWPGTSAAKYARAALTQGERQ